MIKISKYELLKLVVLTDSNVKLEETTSEMINSTDKLNNQMGLILDYLSYDNLDEVRNELKNYSND